MPHPRLRNNARSLTGKLCYKSCILSVSFFVLIHSVSPIFKVEISRFKVTISTLKVKISRFEVKICLFKVEILRSKVKILTFYFQHFDFNLEILTFLFS